MKKLARALFVIQTFLTFLIFTAWAQEGSLSEQFDQMVESSQTYNQFKVIPYDDLTSFGALIEDSLALSKDELARALSSKSELESSNRELNASLERMQLSLEASEAKIGSVDIFGANIDAGTFMLVTGLLILALLVALLVVLYQYRQGFVVVKDARRDLTNLQEEFESFKVNSNQKMVKTKRELQTALNKLEEHRLKL